MPCMSQQCLVDHGQSLSPVVSLAGPACLVPSQQRADDNPIGYTWNPYWVYCKFHGWQQCQACFSEIAVSQATLPSKDNCTPRKRMRVSCDDELSTAEILDSISNLNMDQICTAASALLEHFTKLSSSIEAPHADDIAGLQVIIQLMNQLAVQAAADSSRMHTLDPWSQQPGGVTMMDTHLHECNHGNQVATVPGPSAIVCMTEADAEAGLIWCSLPAKMCFP